MISFDYSKVLTTGSNGMVGSYIDFGIKTNREELDILDKEAVFNFVQKNKPSVIIHLASATDTNLCESNPTYAYEVNGVGTLNVALAGEAVGALMVYVSTSRVFLGDKADPYSESDVPNPNTVYGKSKYLGEIITSIVSSRYIIARGCWMFGGGPLRDDKFYGTMLKQLRNEKIVALGDVQGSPTYAKDFIKSIKVLIKNDAQGIFHIGNSGSATRSEIVEYMLQSTESKGNLKIVGREYFPTSHMLPTNEAITSEKVTLRPWQAALSEYMQAEWTGYLNETQI